jgi:hypothetical protein
MSGSGAPTAGRGRAGEGKPEPTLSFESPLKMPSRPSRRRSARASGRLWRPGGESERPLPALIPINWQEGCACPVCAEFDRLAIFAPNPLFELKPREESGPLVQQPAAPPSDVGGRR